MRRPRALSVALALAACIGGLRPSPAAAQDPGDVRIGITYTPGFRPGLVVLPAQGSPGLEAVAARIDTIVRRDLDYSDRFEIIEVPDSLDPGGEINYGLWDQLGAVWLVTGEVSGTTGAPVLRLGLHDAVYGGLREVAAFTLPSPESSGFRMAVHRAADAAVQWATGDPGIAATRIAFRRKSPDGASDIWTIASDGFGLRRVTEDNSIVYSPAFSPDASHLLYVSYREGSPAVYETDLSSGSSRPISGEPGLNITPSYSPDGSRIALARTAGGGTEIFELQRQPLCCAQRVTHTPAGDALNPTYAPGGRRIAFTSSSLGQPQVFVIEPGQTSAEIISRYVYGEQGYATSPDWSPRGDRIAYHGWIGGIFQILTVNPDGSDRRVLTSRGSNEDPSWAPDGRHLVFASNRGGSRALWVLDTVSGRVRSLTTDQIDQMPDWSPRIAPGG